MYCEKYKDILESLDINELKLCRNEKELRKYLKTKDINLTRAQVYELKEFYCRKIQNTEILSIETLDKIAGGLVLEHREGGRLSFILHASFKNGLLEHVNPTAHKVNPSQHEVVELNFIGDEAKLSGLHKREDFGGSHLENIDSMDHLKEILSKNEISKQMVDRVVEELKKNGYVDELLNKVEANGSSLAPRSVPSTPQPGNLPEPEAKKYPNLIVSIPKRQEGELAPFGPRDRSNSAPPNTPADEPPVVDRTTAQGETNSRMGETVALGVHNHMYDDKLNAVTQPGAKQVVKPVEEDLNAQGKQEGHFVTTYEYAAPWIEELVRGQFNVFRPDTRIQDLTLVDPSGMSERKPIAEPKKQPIAAEVARHNLAQEVHNLNYYGVNLNAEDKNTSFEQPKMPVQERQVQDIKMEPLEERSFADQYQYSNEQLTASQTEKKVQEIGVSGPKNIKDREVEGSSTTGPSGGSARFDKRLSEYREGDSTSDSKEVVAAERNEKLDTAFSSAVSAFEIKQEVASTEVEVHDTPRRSAKKAPLEEHPESYYLTEEPSAYRNGIVGIIKLGKGREYSIFHRIAPEYESMLPNLSRSDMQSLWLGNVTSTIMDELAGIGDSECITSGNDYLSSALHLYSTNLDVEAKQRLQGLYFDSYERNYRVLEQAYKHFEEEMKRWRIGGDDPADGPEALKALLSHYVDWMNHIYAAHIPGEYQEMKLIDTTGQEINQVALLTSLSEKSKVLFDHLSSAECSADFDFLKKIAEGEITGIEIYDKHPEAIALTFIDKVNLYKNLVGRDLTEVEIARIIINDPSLQLLGRLGQKEFITEEMKAVFKAYKVSDDCREDIIAFVNHRMGETEKEKGNAILPRITYEAVMKYITTDYKLAFKPADPVVQYVIEHEKDKAEAAEGSEKRNGLLAEEQSSKYKLAKRYTDTVDRMSLEERKEFLRIVAECKDEDFIPCYEAALRNTEELTESLKFLYNLEQEKRYSLAKLFADTVDRMTLEERKEFLRIVAECKDEASLINGEHVGELDFRKCVTEFEDKSEKELNFLILVASAKADEIFDSESVEKFRQMSRGKKIRMLTVFREYKVLDDEDFIATFNIILHDKSTETRFNKNKSMQFLINLEKLYEKRESDEFCAYGFSNRTLFKLLTEKRTYSLFKSGEFEIKLDFRKFLLRHYFITYPDFYSKLNNVNFQMKLYTFISTEPFKVITERILGQGSSFEVIPHACSTMEEKISLNFPGVTEADINLMIDGYTGLVKLSKLISDQMGLNPGNYADFVIKCNEILRGHGIPETYLFSNPSRGCQNPTLAYKLISLIAACKSKGIGVEGLKKGENIYVWISKYSEELKGKVTDENDPAVLAMNIKDVLEKFGESLSNEEKLKLIYRPSDMFHYFTDYKVDNDPRKDLICGHLEEIGKLSLEEDAIKKLKLAYVKMIFTICDARKFNEYLEKQGELLDGVTYAQYEEIDPYEVMREHGLLRGNAKPAFNLDSLTGLFKFPMMLEYLSNREKFENDYGTSYKPKPGLAEIFYKYMYDDYEKCPECYKIAEVLLSNYESLRSDDIDLLVKLIENINGNVDDNIDFKKWKKSISDLISNKKIEILRLKSEYCDYSSDYLAGSIELCSQEFANLTWTLDIIKALELLRDKNAPLNEEDRKSLFSFITKERLLQDDNSPEHLDKGFSSDALAQVLIGDRTHEQLKAKNMLQEHNMLPEDVKEALKNFAYGRTYVLEHKLGTLRQLLTGSKLDKKRSSELEGQIEQLELDIYNSKLMNVEAKALIAPPTREQQEARKVLNDKKLREKYTPEEIELLEHLAYRKKERVEAQLQVMSTDDKNRKLLEEEVKDGGQLNKEYQEAIELLPSAKLFKGFMIGTGVGSALAIAAIGAAYSLGLLGAAAGSKPVVASSNNDNNDKDKDENQDNNDNAA